MTWCIQPAMLPFPKPHEEILMMKMFMAAAALAGLIGVPAQANAGCGCSGDARSPVTTGAPVTSYYSGGGYPIASPAYQPVPSQYIPSGYSAAPVYSSPTAYSNPPVNYAAPPAAMPMNAGTTIPGQHSPASSLATSPFSNLTGNVPICCAGGGSSCCADGGSSCCQSKTGEVPTPLPTMMQLSTSGNAPLPAQSAAPRSNQAPPMPMSNAASAPTTGSAPLVNDPHVGHQH